MTDAVSVHSLRPRVLLVDDDERMRTAISRLISPECDIVGVVGDTATLFDAASRLRPDVVLLDLSLPGDLNGLDVCRRLTTSIPAIKVLIFTAHQDPEVKQAAREAGASGVVWKMHAATELVSAIRRVLTPQQG